MSRVQPVVLRRLPSASTMVGKAGGRPAGGETHVPPRVPSGAPGGVVDAVAAEVALGVAALDHLVERVLAAVVGEVRRDVVHARRQLAPDVLAELVAGVLLDGL